IEPIDPTPTHEAGFAERERSWLVPAALILVVAITLGIVGVLVGRSDVGHQLFGTDTPSSTGGAHAIKLEPARSFDPEGDREEHDSELGALEDGNPATTWRTSTYDTAAFGDLKSG